MPTVKSKDFLKLSVAEFINQLSDMKALKFTSESGDDYRVVNDYIKDFVKSANLENTERLVFMSKTVDEVVKALLAKSHTLNKLTHLIMPWNNLSVEGIEALARLEYEKTGKLELGNTIRCSSGACKIFYDFLKEEYSKNQSFGIPDENSVKKMIFDVARIDNNGDSVKYILEEPEKYPFLINSKDEQGHTLLHFYAHSPRMQEFLFKHGLIPEKKPEENNESRNISQNKQSVHLQEVSKRTRFTTKKLVEYLKASKDELEQAATSYMENISRFSEEYQKNPMKVRLLSLTEDNKRRVMGENTATVPDDKAFIKKIFEKTKGVLEKKYLTKDRHGNYIEEISKTELQYDYMRDDAKITIPQSIGCIKLLIDRLPIPLEQKKELLVTLAEQNPELVQQKLSSIKSELENDNISHEQITNREKFYALLGNVNADKVNKLFEKISGFNIEETWKEQKEFVLLEEIYEAATTYPGELSNACTQGTWGHIINSIDQIDLELREQCDQYLEEERKLQKQQDSIIEGNVTPFVENLAGKLIQYAKDNPEFREGLVDDFLLGVPVDCNNPEKITFGQQMVLKKINQEFGANIKEFLPNYNRDIPKRDEYEVIINKLYAAGVMQNFASQEYTNECEKGQPAEHTIQTGENSYAADKVGDSIGLMEGSRNSYSDGIDELSGVKDGGYVTDSESDTDEEFKDANESISPEETNVSSIPEKLQPENSALAPDNTEGLFSKNAAIDYSKHNGVKSANSGKESRAGAIMAVKNENAKIPVSDQVNSTQDNNVHPNNPNGITPQNEKKSNLPVMVAASIAITGVATGIAIAVYLEMLAVGIAIGACCLVAAAIIYYCNRPSNSLGSAEVVGNEAQEVDNSAPTQIAGSKGDNVRLII